MSPFLLVMTYSAKAPESTGKTRLKCHQFDPLDLPDWFSEESRYQVLYHSGGEDIKLPSGEGEVSDRS